MNNEKETLTEILDVLKEALELYTKYEEKGLRQEAANLMAETTRLRGLDDKIGKKIRKMELSGADIEVLTKAYKIFNDKLEELLGE